MFTKALQNHWQILIGVVGVMASMATVISLMLLFGQWHPMLEGKSSGAVADQNGFGSFVLHDAPRPLPEITFQAEFGTELSLADFSGGYVLLNLWATWCVPCREEMPTLDALQEKLGGDEFEVVALSVDRAGRRVVREFYREVGIQHLGLYIDPSMKSSFALAVGLPTTVFVDRQGQEIGRLVGSAHWDTPEMIKTIQTLMED